MMPDTPLCSIHNCWRDEDEFAIGTGPRATVMARYASEHGIAFQEVQCLRVYIRILTRQEAWDEYGRDRECERRQEEKGVGWYFSESSWGPAAPGVTASGLYYDDPDESGCHRPVTPDDYFYIVGAPTEVPYEWEPDDNDYAWSRVSRDDPRAIPAWECDRF